MCQSSLCWAHPDLTIKCTAWTINDTTRIPRLMFMVLLKHMQFVGLVYCSVFEWLILDDLDNVMG